MADFLLELRCEEIPARMQKGARADLERLFREQLIAAGVTAGAITVWSTPRRLALIAKDLPTATEAVSEEAKGPPEGAPDAAIDGFCRKSGVTRDQLTLRDVKGRNTWFAVIDRPGRAVQDVLAEAIPAIIHAFPWPKSMRWGAASLGTDSLRWVRPLSGIVAILGEDLVECEIDTIRSGYATLGHRFHHPDEITIGGAADYAFKLRTAHVIVDHAERESLIRDSAARAAAAAGLTLVEDEGLVVENAGLTEWPVPLLGRFDEAFLEVPPEVIQLTARVNQKYFVCEDSAGKLANAFICTANIEAADGGSEIVDGNRKVLAARLSDARFFWELDQKTPLAEQAKKLERITFHEKLGTVADKVDRVAKLARWLVEEGIVTDTPLPGGEGPGVGVPTSPASNTHPQPLPSREGASLANLAEQAARLCKADLVTEMVGEFPELQGIMGGHYARAEGLPAEVADAIRDHYKPVGQGDEVPTAPVTVAVSLADKLDTLVGFFAVDLKPTGSKDPFALRRQSIGSIEYIERLRLRASMTAILQKAIEIALECYLDRSASLSESIDEFVKARRASGKISLQILVDLVAPKGQEEVTTEYVDALVTKLKASHLSGHYLYLASEMGRSYLSAPKEALAFIIDRLKVQQREAGVRHDLIDAVFALGGEDDLVRLLARVHALQAFIGTEDGANLLSGYKRAANILKKEGHQSPLPGGEGSGVGVPTSDEAEHPHPTLPLKGEGYIAEPAEQALIEALGTAEPRAASAIVAEDFAGAMSALASLRGPIDAFFDKETGVMVNDPDQDKRSARLDLLARFRAAVHNVADFSRIEG